MDILEIKELAKAIVEEMVRKYNAELAPKWEGSSILFIPKNSELKD